MCFSISFYNCMSVFHRSEYVLGDLKGDSNNPHTRISEYLRAKYASIKADDIFSRQTLHSTCNRSKQVKASVNTPVAFWDDHDQVSCCCWHDFVI